VLYIYGKDGAATQSYLLERYKGHPFSDIDVLIICQVFRNVLLKFWLWDVMDHLIHVRINILLTEATESYLWSVI
jgi:hypothetical protein